MKKVRLFTTILTGIAAFTAMSFLKVNAVSLVEEIKTADEAISAKFNTISNATGYNAYVKNDEDANYQQIAQELINVKNNLVEVNALGLKAGSYNLKFVPIISGVEDSSKGIELKDINVSASDRSGYAHFGHNNGVGAYNNDGTLKSNADVIYVTEETKNTVQYNGATGLANILKSNLSNPLDIRIIGNIGAPKWNKIEYKDNSASTGSSYYVGNTKVTKYGSKIYDIELKSLDGTETLTSTTSDYSVLSKYNTLDNSYPALNGLKSQVSYGTTKKNDITINDYDSYFNMMEIDSKNNITIEGVGEDATITQWGFTWKRCNYIEVKNLTFNDYSEDACSFENSSETGKETLDQLTTGYIWVHNNTFNQGKNNWDVSYEQDKHEGDGATDIKGIRNVTIAYNHYYNNHKTSLIGGSSSHHQANITFHHNWYQSNMSRLPYARQANMHMYNNYYDSSTDNNMQIYDGAYAFIENCYFKNISKTFETKQNSGYSKPAIKLYNNSLENCTLSPSYSYYFATDRELEVDNGNFVSPTFDTDPLLFYYDSENHKSDVTRMDDPDDIPTLIPNVAGAGIFNDAEYSIVSEEEEENPVTYDNKSYITLLNDDFSNNVAINKTSNIPTNGGLYYRISYKDGSTSYDRDADEYNNVTINNGVVRIYDNSSKTQSSTDDGMSATTRAYYIFNSNNQYTSSVVTYSIDLILSTVNSKWAMLSFIDENGESLSIYSNSNKELGYKIGDTEYPMFGSAYSAGTFNIKLIVDYDNDTTTLYMNDTSENVSYNPNVIKGYSFVTSEGSARTYSFDNVKIQKNDNLKLGYQLGRYTKDNQSFKALRIIGKMEYNEYYDSLDEIANIQIVVDIVNLNNVTKTIKHDVKDVYECLLDKNNKEVAAKEDNVRYYYTVIKGINDNYIGYKINAKTIITLNNGNVIECSGFSYTIE